MHKVCSYGCSVTNQESLTSAWIVHLVGLVTAHIECIIIRVGVGGSCGVLNDDIGHGSVQPGHTAGGPGQPPSPAHETQGALPRLHCTQTTTAKSSFCF